jgi:hypothetical protein
MDLFKARKRLPASLDGWIEETGKMRKLMFVLLLILGAAGVSSNLRAQSVFVSTQTGGQILKVDTSQTNTFTIVSGNPGLSPFGNGGFSPEGLTIGPDGKIYITDPSSSKIDRMNQDGTQPETVYVLQGFFDHVAPGAPQGPSFSSSSTGDLYFNSTNTSSYDRGVFAITGVGTIPYPYTEKDPTHVAPTINTSSQACVTFCPGAGGGTAFDSADNLLFVEQSGGTNPDSVLTVGPPYAPTDSPTTVTGGLNQPIGLAFNKATGQMFIANTGAGQILAIGTGGTTTTYYSFSANSGCGNAVDQPTFMQFDGLGNLYVVTSTDPTGGSNACGRVWRIPPPNCDCSTTLILDLQVAYSGAGHSGLNSPQAIGIAFPSSGAPSQPQTTPSSGAGSISPGGGALTFGWPAGCTPAAGGGAGTCSHTYGLAYPAGMFNSGDTVSVTPTETSQVDWASRTPVGNAYAGTQIAQIAGYGGDGVIYTVSCTNTLNGSCATPPPSNVYITTNSWKSTDTNWCTEQPQMLKAEPATPNTWEGVLDSCTGDPIHKGPSGPTLSFWANVKGVTGAAPLVTITTPTNGAVYNQNQVVDANYNCAPPLVVAACIGGPDLVNGTTTVPNGSPIDTSTLGMHQFQVATDVNSGPGVVPPVTVMYNVVTGPQATANPAAVNFGTFHVPGLGIQVVTLTDTGTAPLSISRIRVTGVTGGDSDDFFALGLCPKTLGVGRSCFIIVSFFADEVPANNPQRANLTITDNATGGSLVVPLSATVVKR